MFGIYKYIRKLLQDEVFVKGMDNLMFKIGLSGPAARQFGFFL